MKFKSLLMSFGAAAVAVSASAAGSNIGLLIGNDNPDFLNSQESAAYEWFTKTYSDGVIITPSTLSKLNHTTLDAVWVNFDRVGLGQGNIPQVFSDATESLKTFLADGGNIYLSKFATQMVVTLGRLSSDFQVTIYGDGEGGNGTDVWNVNAYIGSWQENPDNSEPDNSQVYDHRSHPIYAGLTEFQPYAEWNPGCPHPAFPLEGTGNGTDMWREDHNCMWDLNAYTYSAEGKNTVEKFQNQNNCTVLGTWGHVQDYAVAGIIEFNPENGAGRIIANGLAAYEWAPRSGINAYASNIEKLTANTLNYLAPERVSDGIADIEATEKGVAEYYNLQGVRVANPSEGLFIKVVNGKASKVYVK